MQYLCILESRQIKVAKIDHVTLVEAMSPTYRLHPYHYGLKPDYILSATKCSILSTKRESWKYAADLSQITFGLNLIATQYKYCGYRKKWQPWPRPATHPKPLQTCSPEKKKKRRRESFAPFFMTPGAGSRRKVAVKIFLGGEEGRKEIISLRRVSKAAAAAAVAFSKVARHFVAERAIL